MKIKTSFLYAVSAFLLIVYLLSFTKLFDSDSRKKIKTSLLNPKYKNQVEKIELLQGDSLVVLKKNGDFWILENSDFSQGGISAPAASSQVEKLLSALCQVKDLYKISDRIPSKNEFGLDNAKTFQIRCYYNGTSSELFLGNQDFSGIQRYVKSGKSDAVYQIDSYLEAFLTVSSQFWLDSEIISKNVLKALSKSDIQSVTVTDSGASKILKPGDSNFSVFVTSLLSLRHGGVLSADYSNIVSSSSELLKLKLELGNKNEVILKAYKTADDGEIALSVSYKNQDYTSFVKISPWTFLKLKL